jgi:aspartate/methionine/tyrosine aminotransferase
MAATFDPGDEVLIEHPTYELLESTALYLAADLKRFERRFEDGFRLDPAEVERQITSLTELIILTNLHTPSGNYADEDTIRKVDDIAKSHGARVLVDEVYLESFYGNRPTSACHFGEHFLVTSSLTRAFGLSGIAADGCSALHNSPIACGASTISMRRLLRIPPSGSASLRSTISTRWLPAPEYC